MLIHACRLDEFFKAAAESGEAVRQAPQLSDNAHSPFNARFGVPLFQYYRENPEAALRFGKALKGVAKRECDG